MFWSKKPQPVPLTDKVRTTVAALFRGSDVQTVTWLLETRCSAGLPGLDDTIPQDFDRVQLAVLKLSQGSLGLLQLAIDDANADWRDVLVAAGFGDDTEAHLHWRP